MTDQRFESPLAPNLFIIGASKAGTSALHRYLSFHPEIRMSDEKEPCYFVDQKELTAAWPVMARRPYSHLPDAYLRLFTGGERCRYRGEGSVYYSQRPHRSGVAERIASAAPDAHIIYVVREPVSRSISHYWQRAKEFQESLPLSEALVPNSVYLDTSDYAMQLEPYLDYFDPKKVHVVIAEDLRDARRETLAKLVMSLGLEDRAFSSEELQTVHVSGAESRRQRFEMVRAIRDSWAWARVRERLPGQVVNALREAATIRFEKASVDDQTVRCALTEHFAPLIKHFERLIGFDIPAWRTKRPDADRKHESEGPAKRFAS